MKTKSQVSLLFLVAAIYDGVLGGAFLVAPKALFEWFKVAPPNHYGYVHFPAALLIVFAVMFLSIALKPINNRRLIGIVTTYFFFAAPKIMSRARRQNDR